MNKIIEHFEFILFILYQVAVRDQSKEQINKDVRQRAQEVD